MALTGVTNVLSSNFLVRPLTASYDYREDGDQLDSETTKIHSSHDEGCSMADWHLLPDKVNKNW
jgi:hypothetical protein